MPVIHLFGGIRPVPEIVARVGALLPVSSRYIPVFGFTSDVIVERLEDDTVSAFEIRSCADSTQDNPQGRQRKVARFLLRSCLVRCDHHPRCN